MHILIDTKLVIHTVDELITWGKNLDRHERFKEILLRRSQLILQVIFEVIEM